MARGTTAPRAATATATPSPTAAANLVSLLTTMLTTPTTARVTVGAPLEPTVARLVALLLRSGPGRTVGTLRSAR